MPRKQSTPWREYAGYFRAHRALLAGVTLAGVVQSFAYLPLAIILRRTFDVILPARDFRGLWIAVGELLALQIGSLVLGWWIRITGLRANQDVLARLRSESLRHLYELPRSFHTAADAEMLHFTLVNEINWIERMNNALTAFLLPGALSAIVLFLILFWTQPVYALLIAVCAPALLVVNRLMVRRLWFAQERLREASEDFSRGVRFAISALELTRSQAAEEMELGRQGAKVEKLRGMSLDLTRYEAGQQLLQNSMILTATLAVLLAGGWAAAGGRITRGEIMAFYVVAALFAGQARIIVDSIPAVRMGMRAFRQVADLLAIPEREPYSGTEEVASIEELRLDDVSFGYGSAEPLIERVHFAVRRGERVAVVGANGSGKSTLLYLIAGFYRPRQGAISVNGVSYDRVSMQSLRVRMAIVAQNPFLFGGTVRENVAYGSPETSPEAVWEALRWAGAEDFVAQLPEGLNALIGDNGVRLSGGQRQRLVIARALLRRPDLLILDEPTNHLDDAGIASLIGSLDGVPFRPAVIVISHEWRVLRHATRAWRIRGRDLVETALEYRP
ncbi:MAG TPA: ABC transporter ATP-binding protein [Bryobacteraceae bacterium]|nr:ABC transporter ATP-binding protein [Bryobacteraceae bacterium]